MSWVPDTRSTVKRLSKLTSTTVSHSDVSSRLLINALKQSFSLLKLNPRKVKELNQSLGSIQLNLKSQTGSTSTTTSTSLAVTELKRKWWQSSTCRMISMTDWLESLVLSRKLRGNRCCRDNKKKSCWEKMALMRKQTHPDHLSVEEEKPVIHDTNRLKSLTPPKMSKSKRSSRWHRNKLRRSSKQWRQTSRGKQQD